MPGILVTGGATRDAQGRFRRTRLPWTPDVWDDGYVDNNGYFRVYRPDFPKAYAGGYAKRYHVNFWLNTGRVAENEIHHKDLNKLNDAVENLVEMDQLEHAKLHNVRKIRSCRWCNGHFYGRKKPKQKYCTLDCYYFHVRSK